MRDFAKPGACVDRLSRRAALVERWQAFDLLVVKAAARPTKRPIFRILAVAITKLGNGSIYLAIVAAVFLRWGLLGFRIVAAALATTGILHALYPRIKRRFLRLRPYAADAELECLAPPLDRYSFPSGHTMTLAGVVVPLVVFWHAAWPTGVAMGLCLAWSRLATAHHYPSDILAGALLGAGVGLPVAAIASWVW